MLLCLVWVWSFFLSKYYFLFCLQFCINCSGLMSLLQVASFFRREVYTVIFLVAGVVGAVVVSCNMRDLSMVPAFVWASCWFLSGFTLMPTQISDDTALVWVLWYIFFPKNRFMVVLSCSELGISVVTHGLLWFVLQCIKRNGGGFGCDYWSVAWLHVLIRSFMEAKILWVFFQVG